MTAFVNAATPGSRIFQNPNAYSFFVPVPAKVPFPQNTMPSEIEAPALHMPPLLNDQRMAPVLAFIATIVPMPNARLQPNTTPFAPLTGASERLPIGSLLLQTTAPVFRPTAAHPPEMVVLPASTCQGMPPVPRQQGGCRCSPQPRRWFCRR